MSTPHPTSDAPHPQQDSLSDAQGSFRPKPSWVIMVPKAWENGAIAATSSTYGISASLNVLWEIIQYLSTQHEGADKVFNTGSIHKTG